MKSLPQTKIDLIRDGVAPRDLKERGERAVWSALLSTAASAQQRDWTYSDWAGHVDDPRSNLGRQVKVERGRKPRTKAGFEKQLLRAWDSAAKWLSEQDDPFDRAEITAKLHALRDKLADPDTPLDPVAREILAYAVTVGETHGTDRPALPRRAVVKATGLPERKVREGLHDLEARGLLVLEVPGRRGEPGVGRANLYRLPDSARVPVPIPASGSMGRPQQVYGTPEFPPLGTSEQVYGTHRPTIPEQGEAVVSFTVTASTPAALAEIMRLLSARPDVAVDHLHGNERPDNVVPITAGARHVS